MKLVRIAAILLASASALSVAPAFAADAAPEYTEQEISSAIEVAFGATLTSRYVSRGVAQTNGVAVQGYIEPSYGIFYAGVWASNVDLAPDRAEIDLYAGIRPEFGDLTVDLGYVHYFYDKTGSYSGEFYVKPTYAFTDEFSAGAELYYDPKFKTTYGALTAEIALPENFAISGGVGTWFDNRTDWNAGISYTFQEVVTLDLRYHDSNHSPERFVASLSFDTSFGLGN